MVSVGFSGIWDRCLQVCQILFLMAVLETALTRAWGQLCTVLAPPHVHSLLDGVGNFTQGEGHG